MPAFGIGDKVRIKSFYRSSVLNGGSFLQEPFEIEGLIASVDNDLKNATIEIGELRDCPIYTVYPFKDLELLEETGNE